MKQIYQSQLQERLEDYFKRYADGLDVTPAMRFGTEGYIQAGLDLALITPEDVVALKQQAYRQFSGSIDTAVLAALSGDHYLPSIMKRAPVKPSTSG